MGHVDRVGSGHTGRVSPGPDRKPGAGFVGRGPELAAVGALLAAARQGRGGALLVTGEAGVGKTRLLAHACAVQASDFLVLSGACLPLSSLSVPLLPLRAAVRTVPPDQRPRVLTGSGQDDLGPAALQIDSWLDDRCERGPVVLVVDDLQWADQSTLDVLMCVLAGLPTRALAVLATVRRGEGEVPTGHRLRRWLADVRRLPGFAQLTVDPLDLTDTREQVEAVMGDVPHDSLVRQVFTRTRGNPYLNRLLVEELSATSVALESDLPEDLSSAVLRGWHRLSPPARELARTIAVGGQVAGGRALDHAVALALVEDREQALRECVDAGVLEPDGAGGYWFHHPLQAEALESTLDPSTRSRLHAAFAAAVESDLAAGPAVDGGDLTMLSVVADHHHRAGHDEAAYEWSLRAAESAANAGAGADQLRLLRRALDSSARLDGARGPAVSLWQQLRQAAEALGDHDEELSAVEALLAELDPSRDALDVAELLVRRQHLRFSTGRSFLDQDEMRAAVRASLAQPASWQHALAQAELAHAALWHDDPEAPVIAARALELARACGHPRALAHALAAGSMLAAFEDRNDEGRVLGRDGALAAARAGDGWAFVHATLWEANCTETGISSRWADLMELRRHELAALGVPQPYVAWLASNEAGARLHAGEWQTSARLLRTALGSKPGALVDVQTRLSGARMAAAQGRTREAEGHLARAEELFRETSSFLAFEFDAARAIVRLSSGDLRGAVAAALAGTVSDGVPPTMCEWLLPLAARALGDLAELARDSGADASSTVAEAERLFERFPHTISDVGAATPVYERQVAGLDALYRAEVARVRAEGDAARRWQEAAERLHALLPWDECYALWRWCEALFVLGPSHRDEAVTALRASHALALRLRAQPVLDQLEAVARSARVPLSVPAVGPGVVPGVGSSAVPVGRSRAAAVGLTAREQEILGHVVAGRTYGEIARALVLSEKTVSSHISNVLRKTGCANRVDLARWATRGTADPGEVGR